jgi:pimeloyl-ACP methyl ester carboxylesterase
MPDSPRTHLVLLCGLLCDRRVWEAVAEQLEDLVETSIFSFAGCTSIGEMADEVLTKTPGRFALAGHSMGGRVALEVYRRAPDRVLRLALLNTGVHPVKASEVAGRQRLLDIANRDGMAAVAEDWLPPMVGVRGKQDHALMKSLREMVCGYSPEAFSGQIRALLDRPDAEDVLTRVAVPTLLLCSEEDRWSPVAQHQEMQRALPGSRLVAFEGAGHMSIVESPEAVAAALKGWLTAQESSRDG